MPLVRASWSRLVGIPIVVTALAVLAPGGLGVPARAASQTSSVNYPIAATNCRTITFDQWVNQGDTVTVTFDSATYAGPTGSYCMAAASRSTDPAVVSTVFTDTNGQNVNPAVPNAWAAWPNGTLVITAVGAGTFSLGFADAFSGVNSAFRFDVRVHPATPTTPAVSLSGTTATISTGRSDSGAYTDPTSFLVTADPGGATCSINPGAFQSSCDIAGLTPGTTYTFTATASNAAGTSDPSSASASVTPPIPATVPDAPTGLVATRGDASASIAFTAGPDGGSAITNYEYSLDNGASWTPLSPAVTASPVTITGLTNLTQYSIQLRAVNGVGNGAASSPVLVTPRGTPEAPSITSVVSGDESVAVTVTPASFGPVATSYTVTANPGGRTCVVSNSAGGSCTVGGLTNGSPYTFTAFATNAVGDSEPSAASRSVTPQGSRPPQPQPQPLPGPIGPGGSLLLVDGRPATVTVTPSQSWTGLLVSGPGFDMTLDGLNANGKPLGLTSEGVLLLQKDREVQTSGIGFQASSDVDLFIDPPVAVRARSSSQGLYVGTVRTDTAGSFSGRVTLPAGLAAGQHTLQAVGKARTGVTRSLSLGVLVNAPTAKVPGAVRHLSVSVETPRSAIVSWPRPQNGAGARYLVRVTSAGRPVFRESTGALSQNVNDLVPGCPYVVEVTAINDIGRSPVTKRTFVAGIPVRSSTPMGDMSCRVL